MSFADMAIWLACLTMQAVVVVLLVRSRAFRQLPVFTLYIGWTILSDLAGMAIRYRFPNLFFHWFLFEMPFDSVLQFGVLVELSWSVLRPLRRSLPRSTVWVLAGLILLAGGAVWPIAGISVLPHLTPTWHFLMRTQQTCSILRILIFLVLAAGSQLLSLGWRDRELQVATGLGFYSLASLAAALLHAQHPGVAFYHSVDQLAGASYVLSLVYWAVCFAQKEAPRHEFSPQMESFLLRVSGAARSNRLALEKNGLPGDPLP